MRVPPASIYFPEEDRRWILEQIEACLDSGRLTLGKHGEAFEAAFAGATGTRFAAAVSSGTSALEIILRSIGVAGREVIVPANTFYATAGAVVHAGGVPKFVDCEPQSLALDADSLRQALTPSTAAVIVVHIGGLMSPALGEIRRICDNAGVPLVEDAAHAHGSALDGRPAGSFGLAGAYSFYPTKVMTSVEGGMIVTDDESLYREALIYRDQGKEGFNTNFHVRLGHNWRMSELHAIVGEAQLTRLGEFVKKRREIAAIYDESLRRSGGPVKPVLPAANCESSYYKYVAMLDSVDRVALKQMMRERFDVGLSGEVYETPCHKQPVFKEYAGDALPGAEAICAKHICLPISATMTPEDARYVVDSLAACCEQLGRSRSSAEVIS